MVNILSPLAGCYVLTKACPGAQSVDERKGVPLSAAEQLGVKAALDMLGRWEADCGLKGPPGADGNPTSPKGVLEPMLQNGSICKEVVADPKKTGASSSNPHTGNGIGQTTGCNWTTQGHPGVTITPPSIPVADASGQYNPKDVASLAGMLLHELQHLINPNNAANDEKEYEGPAYRDTIKELCKVAGCPAASQAEKDAVCDYILKSNKELCRLGLTQQCCSNCPNGGGPGPTGGGCIHCDYGGSPSPGTGVKFQDQTCDEFYFALGVQGSISLDVTAQRIYFKLYDSNGTRNFEFQCFDPGLTFVGTSFTSIGDTTLLVGGFDGVTFDGELVRVEFDPLAGQVTSSQSVLVNSGFVTAGSMDLFPGDTSRVAFLDHVGDSVFVYNFQQGTLLQVANLVTAPTLATMKYVSVRDRRAVLPPGPVPFPVPRFGYEIWVTKVPKQHQSTGILLGSNLSIIDTDGNGTFETIQAFGP